LRDSNNARHYTQVPCKRDRIPDYYVHESKQWLVFPHELNGLKPEEIRQHKPALARYMDKLELLLKPGL